jgi:hypothetical protein
MHGFIQMSYQESISPSLAIPLSVLLFTLFVIIVLAQRQRAKIRRQKNLRLIQRINRRETYIQIATEDEEAYINGLKEQGTNDRSKRR